MKFERAYASGWPTKVIRPGGSEVLVLGFVRFQSGVCYVDDAYLDSLPTTHCVHVVLGTPKAKGNALVVGEHVFLPIEHGEGAAEAWNCLIGSRDPKIFYDATEVEARKAYTTKILD